MDISQILDTIWQVGIGAGSIWVAFTYSRSAGHKQMDEESSMIVRLRGERIGDLETEVGGLKTEIAELRGQLKALEGIKSDEIADKVVERLKEN